MARKKKGKPMRRAVYLFERVRGRTAKSILNGKREIKIGIGKDVYTRRQQVDTDLPGKWVLLDYKVINQASRVETRLHKKYAEHQFTVQGGKPGSGQTECYRLTPSLLRQLKRDLNREAYPPDILVLLFITGLATLLMYILHNYL